MSISFEWLDWLEPSGPFLAAPVLKQAFPQGLDTLDPDKRRTLRQAYDEYRQALDEEDPDTGKLHAAWIDLVLRQGLEYDENESGDNLKPIDDLPDSLVIQVAEHGVTLKPDYAVVDDQETDKPMLLIQVYAPEVDLNDAVRGDGWASSPKERMVRLCRDTGSRLGLVTNGKHWLFVDAPVGAVSSFASWYARLWGPEPVLLQAFVALLGIRRFFVAEDEQLPALIDKSVEYQDEVTEALGEQVRRAVEVLIQALDKADVDRKRELLKDVDPRELYEAGLTVMMRLVFLLSAEERELLLLGDERYEANYAISTLRMQLRGEDDAILQRRWDAWSRLLAIFRAIYGGIEHETLRMPALGGSLFDPDRFPFLEGREKDSSWKTDPAKPLPIDNQTVLLLLDAIQLFEGRTLSYRGLDIEQLGYVYEGLLDHTVKRAKEVTLELDATKSAKQPWVTLGELESARLDGDKAAQELLKERTGSSISRVRNDLKKEVKPQHSVSLLTACHNNQALHDQLRQYFHLIRTDSWGRPLVYPEGSFMVTTGEDRRQTGSHYTPTSLTEAIVEETLEPVVYVGPAEGKPRQEWQLKSSEELLNLKICDPAMGSGAFLVQVCRWLGERVVESWEVSELRGRVVDEDGAVADETSEKEPLPKGYEERSVIARRLIAERCIYGVDLNPLAVELAKLSIWLVTLAKGRPFSFLDHNLKCGDSLLGISQMNQFTELSSSSGQNRQARIFGQGLRKSVNAAIDLRMKLRAERIRDIRDVTRMAVFEKQAHEQVELCEVVADAFIGAKCSTGSRREIEEKLDLIAALADQVIEGDKEAKVAMTKAATKDLAVDTPEGIPRRPLHWPLEYPEVFSIEPSGFDALIGNPPYSGGKKIGRQQGVRYRQFLRTEIAEGRKGSADLCVYFLLRTMNLVNDRGCVGLVTTNSISEGHNREVGLDAMLAAGAKVYRAIRSLPWPGSASVSVTPIWVARRWDGLYSLDNEIVEGIDAYLSEPAEVVGNPHRLSVNASIAFQGTIVQGKGFVLSKQEAEYLLNQSSRNKDVIVPYLRGEDFNSNPDQSPSRFVINFQDWPLERAKKYPECLQLLTEKVKPVRDALIARGAQVHEYDYWKFSDKRLESYARIACLDRVLYHPFTSKYLAFSFTPSTFVFAAPHTVFGLTKYSDFCILQSNIHESWVRRYASTLETRMRYAYTVCFETFPFPISIEGMDNAGSRYFEHRKRTMLNRDEGLTKTYNRFHDQRESSQDIQKLRELQVEMDETVCDAYGWTDLRLNHGYQRSSDGERFSISSVARKKILQRLLALNFERYAEEKGLESDPCIREKNRDQSQSEAKTKSRQGELPID